MRIQSIIINILTLIACMLIIFALVHTDKKLNYLPFDIGGGELVMCAYVSHSECGAVLTGCENGRKYHCWREVTELTNDDLEDNSQYE